MTSASAPVSPRAVERAHEVEADEVARRLEVVPATGLTEEEARRRLDTVGPNALDAEPPPSVLGALREAVSEPFVILLAIAGGLAVALGEVRDGLLVLAGLVPIVGADVLTSYRAERALATLREASAPRARIRRDGTVADVSAADLVPGDVVLLRPGELVPADLRWTRADGLLVDRSMLTGESVPELASVSCDAASAEIAERRSMGYSGSAVVGGRGEGIVVATGSATELGRIAQDLATTERRRSPLQRELDRLVRILVVVAIGLIVITVGLGFVRGMPLGANVLAGVSAAIAAIPEEPPVLLAVILGLGAYRLLKRGVLVRRLSAEETLGAVDLIITDKTGTLTQNRLRLRDVLTPSGPVTDAPLRQRLIEAAIRAEDDAWDLASGQPPGSFTRALLEASDRSDEDGRPDPSRLRSAQGPTDGQPYSLTWATTPAGDLEGLVVGAPEAVLALPLAPGVIAATWADANERRARDGGRLLLVASADASETWTPLAMLDFEDPIRDGVREAFDLATGAGIQTVVVTGDHPATAAAIAAQVGIGPGGEVLGSTVRAWPANRLAAELRGLTVVARAIPEDKLRIVDAARTAGRTVAVTGDGVNDAPALHHADVAVAMGSGTAVAREASDLVLGDDSFVTLMYGLREGRRIVANVQKGLVFLVSTHVALLGFILIATIAGFGQPLLPIQILWLELFIDLVTSIAFEREAEEPGAMTRPPRLRERPLLTRALLLRIAGAGGFSALAALLIMLNLPGSDDHVRWVAFTALVAGQVVRAYANRSLTLPVVRLRPNGLLLAAIAVVLVAQLTIPLVPPLADAFRASPLDAGEWLLIAAIALLPAVVAEAIRGLARTEWVA